MVKVKVRTPSGRLTTKIKKRRPSFAKCAYCGKQLHGVHRFTRNELRKLPKSERRPERPYGGYLCSECTRQLFRERARRI